MEIEKKPFERLAVVWERVEAARPRLEGSAKLMPRKKKGFPLKPFPTGRFQPRGDGKS